MHNPTEIFTKCRNLADQYRTRGLKREQGSITVRKSDTEGSLYLYAPIGAWLGGIGAEEVATKLEAMRGIKQLNVFINSEGGDVMDAKAIYASLQRFGAKKVGYVDGLAASAASFIAMACDELITAPEGTWMIHEAMGFAGGYADDLEAYAAMLRMQTKDIAAIYQRRTGNSPEKIAELMTAETWMNAAQALDLKFTDKVAGLEPDGSAETQNAIAKTWQPVQVLAVTQAHLRASAETLKVRANIAAKEVAERASPSRREVAERASPTQQAKPASR
jgi:ATP-dependent protease ClpP protease subunit